MTVYRARRGQVGYGYAIGMLCAEWHIPFIPGDLNNAWTFPFPVRYLSVRGVVGAEVLRGNNEAFADALSAAARQLQAEGVRAITGNCGFMAAYQAHVAAEVDIPVFLSSLLQAPMLTLMLGPARRLGVLTASGASLTPELLAAAGVTDTTRLVVKGLECAEHFRDVIINECGELDDERMTSEVVQAAQDLVRESPDVGALLLECSDLPPYSHAVQQATGLPVFDWAHLIGYVHNAVIPRRYDGIA